MKQIEDDGRTIADMNLEGTPWFRKNRRDREEEEDFSDLDVKKLIKEAYKKFLLAALVWIGMIVLILLAINYLWLG